MILMAGESRATGKSLLAICIRALVRALARMYAAMARKR